MSHFISLPGRWRIGSARRRAPEDSLGSRPNPSPWAQRSRRCPRSHSSAQAKRRTSKFNSTLKWCERSHVKIILIIYIDLNQDPIIHTIKIVSFEANLKLLRIVLRPFFSSFQWISWCRWDSRGADAAGSSARAASASRRWCRRRHSFERRAEKRRNKKEKEKSTKIPLNSIKFH